MEIPAKEAPFNQLPRSPGATYPPDGASAGVAAFPMTIFEASKPSFWMTWLTADPTKGDAAWFRRVSLVVYASFWL